MLGFKRGPISGWNQAEVSMAVFLTIVVTKGLPVHAGHYYYCYLFYVTSACAGWSETYVLVGVRHTFWLE